MIFSDTILSRMVLLIAIMTFVSPFVVSAQGTDSAPTKADSVTGFVALAPIPGLTEGVTADTAGLAQFFNNLYKFAIGLSAVLAIIMIIWGGLEYATQDSISKKSDGKERIYQAIFGLVLVLAPYLVFSIINPSILNLSLNLPPLDTKSGSVSTQQPTTVNFNNVGISAGSGADKVQVGDAIIKFPVRDSTMSSEQFNAAIKQYRALLQSAQDKCLPPSTFTNSPVNTDGNVVLKCSTPVNK